MDKKLKHLEFIQMTGTNTPRFRVATVAGGYGCLSALVALIGHGKLGMAIVDGYASVMWMLGPLANLLYGSRYVVPYLIGSVLCGAFLAATVGEAHGARRLVGWSGFGFFWLCSGLVSLAPLL